MMIAATKLADGPQVLGVSVWEVGQVAGSQPAMDDSIEAIARDTGFSEEHMATDYATLVGQGIPHDEALAELRRIYSRTLHAAIRRLSRAIFGRKQEPTDRR